MIDIIELNNKYISDVVSIIKKRSNTLNIRKKYFKYKKKYLLHKYYKLKRERMFAFLTFICYT